MNISTYPRNIPTKEEIELAQKLLALLDGTTMQTALMVLSHAQGVVQHQHSERAGALIFHPAGADSLC